MKRLLTQLGTPKTLAVASCRTRSRVSVKNAVRQDSSEYSRDAFDKRVGEAAKALASVWGPKR